MPLSRVLTHSARAATGLTITRVPSIPLLVHVVNSLRKMAGRRQKTDWIINVLGNGEMCSEETWTEIRDR